MSSEFQKNVRKSNFGTKEIEHNFDPLIVGLESGNADSLSWTRIVESNQEPPISAQNVPEASATIQQSEVSCKKLVFVLINIFFSSEVY